MTDGALYDLIDSVSVYHIGEEGIHLRRFSSHNTIQRVVITQTGLKTPDYGEGIYIGSAKNNWNKYTGGRPDYCDSNSVLNSHIGPAIAAECIDIKEGTTGGIIRNNYFDATGITGANSADSWIDVKGNDYRIQDNKFHIAGPSNGGIAAFHVAALNPQYFLSVTAFPGYMWEPSAAKLQAISKMCVFMYVGENDEYMWHAEMKKEAETLRSKGTVARYTVEEGQPHRLDTLAGANAGRLFDGFEETKKGCSK